MPRWERLAPIIVVCLAAGAAIGTWALAPDPVMGRREHGLMGGLAGLIVGALCAWMLQDLPAFGRWVVLLDQK